MNSVVMFGIIMALEVVILCALVVYGIFALFQLFYFRNAPYVKTRKDVRDQMLELAKITQGMRTLEIGSGDGEISIRAAQAGAAAIGFEINPVLLLLSRWRAKQRNLEHQTTFVRRDMFRESFPIQTDVVFAYLLPKTMDQLWPKFQKELKPGTLIISNAFQISQKSPENVVGNIRTYRV